MATTLHNPTVELDAVQSALADVRRRIGANDPTVTVEDLNRAELAVRFAQMKIDAAVEVQAQEREQARIDRIAAIRAELPAIFDTTALDKARAKVEAAVDAYCQEARALEVRVSDVYSELTALQPHDISIESGSGAIGGYRKPSFQRQVRDAVYEPFKRHFPRTQVALDRA